MSVFDVVIILLCVGVLLYLLNLAPFIAANIKTIINWVVIVAVVLWLISLTGILAKVSEVKFPHV